MTEEGAVSEGDSSSLLDSELPTRDNRRAEFEELVRQHNDHLVRYISSWIRNRDDARDIVQQAYVQMFRLGDRRAVSHMRGYLYQTAKNIATDWVRQRIVRESYAEEQPFRSSQEDMLTPEHICLAQEELAALKRAFKLLPPRTRMAFLLIRVDGLSYEEVGAQLGIQTDSVRHLIRRAMEFLVEAVSKDKLKPRGRR